MKMRDHRRRFLSRYRPGISAAELWAYKRAQQRQDLANLRAGRANEEQMSWFSGGRARACQLVDSPY